MAIQTLFAERNGKQREHTKTKASAIGIYERFHKTIMKEFYQVDLPEKDLLIYRGAADRAGGLTR